MTIEDSAQVAEKPAQVAKKEDATQDVTSFKSIADALDALSKANKQAASYRVKLREAGEKLDAVNAKYSELEAEFKDTKAKFSEYEGIVKTVQEQKENERKALIEKLPEDKREAFKESNLDQIKTVLELLDSVPNKQATSQNVQPPVTGGVTDVKTKTKPTVPFESGNAELMNMIRNAPTI